MTTIVSLISTRPLLQPFTELTKYNYVGIKIISTIKSNEYELQRTITYYTNIIPEGKTSLGSLYIIGKYKIQRMTPGVNSKTKRLEVFDMSL